LTAFVVLGFVSSIVAKRLAVKKSCVEWEWNYSVGAECFRNRAIRWTDWRHLCWK